MIPERRISVTIAVRMLLGATLSFNFTPNVIPGRDPASIRRTMLTWMFPRLAWRRAAMLDASKP